MKRLHRALDSLERAMEPLGGGWLLKANLKTLTGKDRGLSDLTLGGVLLELAEATVESEAVVHEIREWSHQPKGHS